MIDTTKLKHAIRRFKDQFEPVDSVYLGRYISDEGDGYHTVDILRPDGVIGERRKVRGRVGAWAGVVVRLSIDRKRFGPDELVIMGPDEGGYGSVQAPSMLENHGPRHGHNQIDQIPNLHTLQIWPLRVQPYSGLTVRVMTGLYYAGGTYVYLDEEVDVDLTASVPANQGRWVYATLSLDSAGSITITLGTERDYPQVGDIATTPAGEHPLCAVLLHNGDTTLTQDRFACDLRYIMGTPAIGGGPIIGGPITVPDDSWIGLGAADGRLVFDSTPTVSTLIFEDCSVGILGAAPANSLFGIADPDAIDVIDAEWDGMVIDGAALDPSVVDVDIHGIHIDFSDIDVTQLPHIDGLLIETPLTYHREYNHAIHTKGGGIWIDWDATTSTTVDAFTAINVVVQTTGAADGDVHILDVARGGTGTVDVNAIGTHVGVGVIHQHVGTFASSAKAWRYQPLPGPTWFDATADFADGGSVMSFQSDNNVLYISGAAVDTTFDELQILMSVVYASKSIKPKFEYSVAGPGWTQFYPTDDTRGFQQDGTIRWIAANLTGWARIDVNAEGETRYWVRITRQRNNLVAGPTVNTIDVLDATAYYWDKLGNINVLGGAFDAEVVFSAGIEFDGASAANIVEVPDNIADALSIEDGGGLEYLRIDSRNANPYLCLFPSGGGKVGIGTTVPKSVLQIQELIGLFQTDTGSNASSNFARNAYYDGAWKRTITDAEASLVQLAKDESFRFYQATDGNDAADSAITWTERFRIDSSGNVGIHDTTPSSALQIGVRLWLKDKTYGDPVTPSAIGGVGERIVFYGNDGTTHRTAFGMLSDNGIWMQVHGVGALLELWSGAISGAPTQKFTVLANGRVGIGVAAPVAKLHVDQSVDDAAIPVLILDQADISDGFINFIGSDRGVIAGATNSLKSVRVEIGGVVHRLALYADA